MSGRRQNNFTDNTSYNPFDDDDNDDEAGLDDDLDFGDDLDFDNDDSSYALDSDDDEDYLREEKQSISKNYYKTNNDGYDDEY